MSDVVKSDNEIIDDVLQFLNRGNKNTSYTFTGLYLLIPKDRRGVIEAKLYKYDLIEHARTMTSSDKHIKITANAKIILGDYGTYSNYINEINPKPKVNKSSTGLEENITTALNRLYNADYNQSFFTELLEDNDDYDLQRQIARILEDRGYAQRDQDLVTLTESGRNFIEGKGKSKEIENQDNTDQNDATFFEIDRIHCNSCNHDTDHNIISQKIITETEPETIESGITVNFWTSYIARILKCNACGEHTMKTSFVWCDDAPEFPEKGIEFIPKRGTTSIRSSKSFSTNIPEHILSMYAETVQAYNNELTRLCAGGIRAIIEGMCLSSGIEGGKNSKSIFVKNLEGKINGLAEKGIITINHANILHENRFLGNEALHELEEPSKDELRIAIEIIAHTLSSIYELGSKGAELKNKAAARRTNKTV